MFCPSKPTTIMNVLYVCLAITLFQGIQGFGGVGFQFMNGELVVRPHNSEPVAAETQLFLDDAHCDNVTATLQEMYKLGMNMAMWLNESGSDLVNDMNDFLNCSGSGVVSCILNTFKKTKEDLLKMKPTFDEYRWEFTDLVVSLRKELPLCLH